jgi:uncharacterized membrane protein (UPF0127 family)
MMRDRGREAHSRIKTVLACLAAMLALPSWLAACGNSAAPTPLVSARGNPLGDLTISQGDHREVALTVEIANNEAAWEKGLMGVRNLPADHGMAFVFHRQVGLGFWMKDTLIPLDIAFADAQERIVDVQHMVPCVADPCHTYLAAQPYSLAVEARSGALTAAGVRDGDVIVLKRHT